MTVTLERKFMNELQYQISQKNKYSNYSVISFLIGILFGILLITGLLKGINITTNMFDGIRDWYGSGIKAFVWNISPTIVPMKLSGALILIVGFSPFGISGYFRMKSNRIKNEISDIESEIRKEKIKASME